MKGKKWIWTSGTIIRPLNVGEKAEFLQNGILKMTDNVVRILEQAEDHVKFETGKCCYYIASHEAEECVLCMAA